MRSPDKKLVTLAHYELTPIVIPSVAYCQNSRKCRCVRDTHGLSDRFRYAGSRRSIVFGECATHSSRGSIFACRVCGLAGGDSSCRKGLLLYRVPFGNSSGYIGLGETQAHLRRSSCPQRAAALPLCPGPKPSRVDNVGRGYSMSHDRIYAHSVAARSLHGLCEILPHRFATAVVPHHPRIAPRLFFARLSSAAYSCKLSGRCIGGPFGYRRVDSRSMAMGAPGM